jgi:hypothetical protein
MLQEKSGKPAFEIAFADGTTLRLASVLAGSLYAKAGSQDRTRQ